MRRLIRVVVSVPLASALIWSAVTVASAKGPDQAMVSGPGIDHPIAVRAPGAPTVGPGLAALIESSGIMDQLWCRVCADLTQPHTNDLGPMYLVRYRVPSLIGGPTRWIEQRVYPFAEPRPLTFVQPGQRFWHQRTVGGWHAGTARLTNILVGVGMPRTLASPPPVADDASVTPIGISIALIGGSVAIAIAIIVGLVVIGRRWTHTRSAHTPA